MSDTSVRRYSFIYVFAGVIMTLAVMLLTGAVDSNPQVGRYELSCVPKGSFTDIYVIDTATGVVKWVGNDTGKPFEAIKGQ